MTDHVCAWAAASPARYRASSSSKAASMSSRSNSDERRDPVVGVDLDDAEHLGVERLGPLVAARVAGTTEDEALPAGRDDGRRHVRGAEVGDRPHVCDHGIPTVSEPGVHHPTTIVSGNVVGQHLGHGGPVAGREVCPEALGHLACRVFQPRRRRLSSSNLASAASRSVSSKSSQRLIRSPSTVSKSDHLATRRRSPLARSHLPRWVTTAPRSLSRCTASM